MDSRKFMKPPSDEVSWREDRQDVDEITGTTFIYNRFLNLEIEKQRCLLPIHKYKKHILYLLEKYQTLVLVGDTGSGKSTQVCQYLYENGWVSDNTKIGITEPRRFCVTTLAQRVAEEKNCTLGSIVGYSIRFDDCQDEKLTKIKYMTEGILIREMMADPLLRQYRVIIVDEVHERNILTDIILGLLKKILKKRKKLKLIVTSATVDAVSLRDFFNFKKSKTEEDTSVILAAEGKLHPVTIHYTIEPVPDYVNAVVDCVCKIHEREPEGDILAFLTGSEEVNRAVSLLREHLSENPNKNFTPLILPMYGTLPNNDQLKVFRPAPRGMRKIVISTNIAETSVTIWGIVYVVDCGFVKLKWFNPKTYTDSLVVVPISQASAEQRAGRAGRTRPGKVYRLYPEEEFEKLAVATPPEMSRTDLSQAVLQLKALGISNILRFSFPSPPPAQNLLLALELLYALNAIDDRGELTKPLGITMAEFPLPPLHAKTLISAGDFGCTDEISSILAMLQVDDVFIRPRFGENSIKAQIEKRNFEVHEGDLITYLNVFTAFEKNLESAKRWCMQHFINYKALRRAFEIKYRMLQMLERFDIPKTSCDGNTELVCRSIASGFFSNAAYLQFSGVYKTVRGGEELYVHPTSVLYSVEQPQWLLYCELIHTDKLYMRDVTVIQCSWLEELAPNFYHKVPSASAL